MIRPLHVDTVFMGAHGMDPRSGFPAPNILEAAPNRAVIDAGSRLVVLADHTTWGVVGISSIARLDEAGTLVTDGTLDAAATQRLAALGRRLILVDGAAGDWKTLERRPVADDAQTALAAHAFTPAAGPG